jgi:hypothetical protein
MLICVNAPRSLAKSYEHMGVYSLPEKWLPVSIVPSDMDLEVGVMDRGNVHALIFPVRRSGSDWLDASTKKLIDIAPTHWRKWPDGH